MPAIAWLGSAVLIVGGAAAYFTLFFMRLLAAQDEPSYWTWLESNIRQTRIALCALCAGTVILLYGILLKK